MFGNNLKVLKYNLELTEQNKKLRAEFEDMKLEFERMKSNVLSLRGLVNKKLEKEAVKLDDQQKEEDKDIKTYY